MKVILLAAGRGTRISKEIGDIPKCTVKIIDTPLIIKTVEMLLSEGVSDISIVLGYKDEEIRTVLKNYKINFYYNPFYAVTNSLGSLYLAAEKLTADDDVIIGNADVFWEKQIYDLIVAEKHDYIMLADKLRADNGDYFFRTENGMLREYGKELTRENRDCEYVGLALIKKNVVENFKKTLLKMVKNNQYNLWWENVLYSLCEKQEIYIKDVEGKFWAEVDFIEDYNRIKKYAAEKR